MSAFLGALRGGIDIRIERVATVIEQATAGPVVLRATLVVAALAGFAVTWPVRDLFTTVLILPVALALGVGMAPRSFAPTATIIVMVLGYLVNIAGGGAPDAWRPITAAGLIYIVHTGAAFAAVLPFNTVATAGLYLPFVLRTAAVIAITVVIGFAILAVPRLVGDHRLVSAAVVGMVAMVGVAGYVAYLGSRRR
jgi:hypothetical protein